MVPALPGDAARIRLLDVLEEMLGVFAQRRATLITSTNPALGGQRS